MVFLAAAMMNFTAALLAIFVLRRFRAGVRRMRSV
jgi:hypothetical protein